MKRMTRNLPSFLIIMALFLITACRLDVPIKEMAEAKAAITRAMEVKADKYAPDELKKAREHLFKCHDEVKKEEESEALAQAKKSYAMAQAAINKALPLLAKDSYDEAKKVYDEAGLLYAEKYSSANYQKAGDLLKESEGQTKGGDFWNAHLKAQEALKYAKSAKEESLAHAGDIKSEIDRINKETEDLKANRGGEFAAGEIEKIGANLKEAEASVGKNDLKAAFSRVSEADTQLKEARAKTEKGVAAAKLEEAEKLYKDAEGSKYKKYYEADIAKAGELIGKGKSSLGSGAYKESAASSDEAINLLKNTVSSLGKKGDDLKSTALSKLQSAENSLKTVNESGAKKYYADDIAKATALIVKSRGSFDGGAYEDSIAASDEAIALLNAVNVGMEKKKEETRLSDKSKPAAEGEGEYVVKYNPKNRDCLWKIAFYQYKNAKLWPLIYMANKDQIKDPDLIFPGQKLKIPSLKKKAAEEKKDEEKEESKKPAEAPKEDDKPAEEKSVK